MKFFRKILFVVLLCKFFGMTADYDDERLKEWLNNLFSEFSPADRKVVSGMLATLHQAVDHADQVTGAATTLYGQCQSETEKGPPHITSQQRALMKKILSGYCIASPQQFALMRNYLAKVLRYMPK